MDKKKLEDDKEEEEEEEEEMNYSLKHTWTLEDEFIFCKNFWDQEEKEERNRQRLRKRYFDMIRKNILEHGETEEEEEHGETEEEEEHGETEEEEEEENNKQT